MKIYNKKLKIIIQINKKTRTDGLSIPGREHSKCKGPEVGPCLIGSRNCRESLAWTRELRRRAKWNEV